MATGDVLIQAGGTEAVPFDYELAPAAEFSPKAVRALFDGTNAAGAFAPCLVILGPTDHEVARIRTDEVVAAGASAVVNWFPHVGGGGAVASSLAHARGRTNSTDPHFSAPVGGAVDYPFVTTYESDASIFAWLTSVNPNDQLQLNANGYYALIGTTEWEASTFDSYGLLSVPDSYTGAHGSNLGRHGTTPANAWNSHAGLHLGSPWQIDVDYLHILTAPELVSLSVFNGDVVPHNVIEATLGVIYYGA